MADHTHDIKDIAALALALATKAPYEHRHSLDDTPGLVEVIHKYLSQSAEKNHGHTLEGINGLVDALAAKTDKQHSHKYNDIVDVANLIETIKRRMLPKLNVSKLPVNDNGYQLINAVVTNSSGYCLCKAKLEVYQVIKDSDDLLVDTKDLDSLDRTFVVKVPAGTTFDGYIKLADPNNPSLSVTKTFKIVQK